MPIFNFNCRIVTRTNGKSSIKKSAYIGGKKLRDRNKNQQHNYQKKASEVAYSTIIAPTNSPTWVYNPEELWNRVENRENESKRNKNAQTAREVIAAFPIELNLKLMIELINKYVRENFISEGMIAEISIHNKTENPHVHVLLTTRKLLANPFVIYKNFFLLKDNNLALIMYCSIYLKCKIFGNKEREWNKKDKLMNWRKAWADICNNFLEYYGIKIKISEKSYASQGIKKIPTLHIGNHKNKFTKMEINKNIQKINALMHSKWIKFFQANNVEIEKIIVKIEHLIAENNNFSNKKLLKLIQNFNKVNHLFLRDDTNIEAPLTNLKVARAA